MNDIEKQFNFIAKEYDENRRKFIPCFDDYYEQTTKFILANINTPQCVLDLGAGTGLLTYYWFQECKTAEYVLVDIADEMLDISRKRFAGLENVYHRILDYTKQLPDDKFDTIISAAGSPMMNKWFDSYWENQLVQSELTSNDIKLWKERRKLDRECSVEEEMSMLRQCSFSEVKCVYSYYKFSVIIAVK